ncbi:MAG TPA: hypothetical protein VKU62_14250, partial [Thermoanaerobaculia bacterium]|nr:hypothetical protein [Thermoanaerobaculia bacterium]
MIAATALLLFASAGGTDVPPMRICYSAPNAAQTDCSSVPDGEVANSAEHAGQPYVLFRPAVHELTIAFCCAREALKKSAADFVVERSEPSAPIDVRLSDAAGAKRWRFTLTAGELASVKSVFTPVGDFRLTASASHYREASADLKTQTRMVLRRLPVISGKVLNSSGEPVASAIVQPAENCATTFDGTFRCEMREWPPAIIITHAQMPSRVMPLEGPERDSDLGEIRFSRGGRLNVSIDAPIRSVTLQLFRDLDAKPSVEIAQRSVSRGENASIENIDPGAYRLLIKGSRPLQQRGIRLTIKEGENDQKIAIEDSEL